MITKTIKPLIGLTMTWDDTAGGTYALRQNYCACVTQAGGVPLLLPYGVGDVAGYGACLDGLIVTGGDFDIDPSLFGAKARHERVKTQPNRTDFEMAMTKELLARDKPVLGICGGMQLVNVIHGGTLIQDIATTHEGALNHELPNPPEQVSHRVRIEGDTLLHRIVGKKEVRVNSSHHQAVDKVGEQLRISARADDGIIEAIESLRYRFCLGVQWHPEYRVDDSDVLLFEELVRVAGEG
ncbi:MAG: gamma-glutamyl-gamma-aminobutyrate hydrolase family protein [Alphaproteobacteria bacterium GM202ARS2]|nr:gamma-glutamyl-gamma-aminobutyrate hydrolase family protein [Alphaproteobacteria bacterium GM202ARS2]